MGQQKPTFLVVRENMAFVTLRNVQQNLSSIMICTMSILKGRQQSAEQRLINIVLGSA